MDKAIEAAAQAAAYAALERGIRRVDTTDGRVIARAAILAFLDAAAGDEGVVEMVAKDVFYATMPEDGSPVVGKDHRATAFKAARAALSALKGEVKP